MYPYEKNYLNHKKNVVHIKNSLSQFGYVKTSIVIDENMVLLCGHGTLQAMKELEWGTVPEVVQIKGMSEKTKSAYRIADNSTGSKAEIIIDNLISELELIDESYIMEDYGLEFLGKEIENINEMEEWERNGPEDWEPGEKEIRAVFYFKDEEHRTQWFHEYGFEKTGNHSNVWSVRL